MFDAGEVQSIADPGSKGFDVPCGEEHTKSFFVVHKNADFFAYRNACPHTGASLEWQPHQFLDFDNSFIQCAIHGAIFKVTNGVCLRGPCAGRALEALPLEVKDERIWVDVSSMLQQDEPSTTDY